MLAGGSIWAGQFFIRSIVKRICLGAIISFLIGKPGRQTELNSRVSDKHKFEVVCGTAIDWFLKPRLWST